MKEPPKTRAQASINGARDEVLALSHRIHANPELAWHEVKAAGWMAENLRRVGFEVQEGVADLPTAFLATCGYGDLRVGICAEYDALPGIGHACGHNVIAAAAFGAAIGLVGLVEDLGISLSIIGTPAEEGGGGKIHLLERGVFDEIDVAMMIHPGPVNTALAEPFAVSHLRIRYTGRASHAAAYPEEGVNAADAFVIAQAAIGLLRQHLPSFVRVHGVVTKGGDAPNIIPDATEGRWYVRTRTLAELDIVETSVRKCFEAGAVATGCSVEIDHESPRYSHFHNDLEVLDCFVSNAENLGRSFNTVTENNMSRASTDMANISLVIPSIHPYLGINSLPATNHQREFAELCASRAADEAVIDGATAMAWTAIDLAQAETLRRRLIG